MRWLYHALVREEWEQAQAAGMLAPPSLAREGFVHASYRDVVLASAQLYLPRDRPIVVLQIDPRLLPPPIRVVIAETPRGPMPHVHGAIPLAAVARVWSEEELARALAEGGAPDRV